MGYKATLGLIAVAVVAWGVFASTPWEIVLAWWGSLTQPQATLISALVTLLAAFLGFAGGTIFNHRLTLRREERKDQLQAKQVAATLAAELHGIKTIVAVSNDGRAEKLKSEPFNGPARTLLVAPFIRNSFRLPEAEMFHACKDSIGILPAELAHLVVETHMRYAGARLKLDWMLSDQALAAVDTSDLESLDRTFQEIPKVLERAAGPLRAFAGIATPPESPTAGNEAASV